MTQNHPLDFPKTHKNLRFIGHKVADSYNKLAFIGIDYPFRIPGQLLDTSTAELMKAPGNENWAALHKQAAGTGV